MLPLHNPPSPRASTMVSADPRQRLLHIPFRYFAFVIMSLPMLAFIFCIVCSVLYNFERATFTHCQVANALPSISAAIGSFQPQRFVWQFAILATLAPRIWLTGNYVLLYTRQIRRSRRLLAYVACMLNAVEVLSLTGLSLFTSSDDYKTHKICFIVFIATSQMYMVLTYFVNRTGRKLVDPMAARSLWLKSRLTLANLGSFAIAVYFFHRHNTYCEPFLYSWFAGSEYTVVLTNMFFHSTCALDFHDQLVMFDWSHGFHLAPAGYAALVNR